MIAAGMGSVSGVLTSPGQTAFTLTPKRPRSRAAARTRPITPAFAAMYAVSPCLARSASVEETATTFPDFCVSNTVAAALRYAKTPVRSTSRTACQSSIFAFSRSPAREIPAQRISASRRPHRFTTARTTAFARGRLLTSALKKATSPAALRSGVGRRSATATRQPSLRKRRTQARPIPEAPPVISATGDRRFLAFHSSLAGLRIISGDVADRTPCVATSPPIPLRFPELTKDRTVAWEAAT